MPVHVALRQVGYGECGRRRCGNRVLAAFDTVNDNSRLPARLIGGKLAVPAERHPLRTAQPPALHNVDLSAGGIDPDPKAGQIVIPEHGILALDREQIDGAFGDRQIVSFGHGRLPVIVRLSGDAAAVGSGDSVSGVVMVGVSWCFAHLRPLATERIPFRSRAKAGAAWQSGELPSSSSSSSHLERTLSPAVTVRPGRGVVRPTGDVSAGSRPIFSLSGRSLALPTLAIPA